MSWSEFDFFPTFWSHVTYLITWVRVNLNSGSSAAVGEPGAGVVLPQVAGGEVHLGDGDDDGDLDEGDGDDDGDGD